MNCIVKDIFCLISPPFKNEKSIHLETSTGLRYLDKVIGWRITHVVDEQTIRYDTLYVDHEFLHLDWLCILDVFAFQSFYYSLRINRIINMKNTIFFV
jgi:hypothetical protein